MKYITLTQGKFALVDDEDFDYLNQFRWHYHVKGYAARNDKMVNYVRGKTIFMHREVNHTPDNLITDHINRNKLDNRRTNLRNADYSLNHLNKSIQSNNTSGFTGVRWDSKRGKWLAKGVYKGKQFRLGQFDTAEKAKAAKLEFDRNFI